MSDQKTSVIARIAMLSALVVLFDYGMKFPGWKIVFPWLPFLKFDFTGVPIMLSLLITGLGGGAATSAVAFLAILVRSGDIIGASMKAIAEFSTATGFYIGSRIFKGKFRFSRILPYTLGCITRILVMFPLTVSIFVLYYGSLSIALALSPLVSVFNLFHGIISISGGDLLYETLKRRAPHLILTSKERFKAKK